MNTFKKIRSSVLVLLTHKIALPVLRRFRSANRLSYTSVDLMFLPSGSLGNDLYHFLTKRNLPLLDHYVRHDLKHVLLNYDTTEEGEVCLQSFMLGNGRVSFPVIATVLYGLFTMPEHWKSMRRAYRKGKCCHFFHDWSWNEVLVEQTTTLRNRIFERQTVQDAR